MDSLPKLLGEYLEMTPELRRQLYPDWTEEQRQALAVWYTEFAKRRQKWRDSHRAEIQKIMDEHILTPEEHHRMHPDWTEEQCRGMTESDKRFNAWLASLPAPGSERPEDLLEMANGVLRREAATHARS